MTRWLHGMVAITNRNGPGVGRLSVAVVTVATAALACGGGPTAGHVASVGGHATPSAPADPRTAPLQFAACMRAHGVNVADPTFGQNGAPQWSPGTKETLSQNPAAYQACSPILLRASGGPPQSPPTAAQLAQLTRFAQCIRQHGVPDFPDPDPQNGHFHGYAAVVQAGASPAPGVDPGFADAFAAAYQACRQYAPPPGLG